MAVFVKIDFVALEGLRLGAGDGAEPARAAEPLSVVVFVGEDLTPAPAARALLGEAADTIGRAAAAAGFKGKARTAMEILAPSGIEADRLLVVGIGKDPKPSDVLSLGGSTMSRLREGSRAIVVFDLPGGGGRARDGGRLLARPPVASL